MSEPNDDERTINDAIDDVTDEQNVEDTEATDDGEKSNKEIERRKKVSCKEKKWSCEDTPLWRIFMKSYIDQEKRLEIADKFDRRKPAVLPKFPNVVSSEQIPRIAANPCFPLNTFNLEEQARLPDKRNRLEKIRLWRKMQNDPAVDMSSFLPEPRPEVSRTDSKKWPATWPCVTRDLAGEKRNVEKSKKRRAKGLLPCQEDTDNESNPDVPKDDFADHKELGHARVPISCPSVKKMYLVDRSCGDKPGLVDGDYVIYLFDKDDNEKSQRVYADVCLRGMKGMHLLELRDERVRKKTWKFCLYQAVVALLAKTQLRYKFAWSVNIDYIFDHAWMLFIHMGSINVKERIRFDDVVVYNYKYSVELELVHEMKDVPRITGVSWSYAEKEFESTLRLERPELMKTRESIGWEKAKVRKSPPVHELTRKIEEWFDELPLIYRNCIFRTPKFSLAFWKDETFWYLYNPYRCDEFGLWHDEGFACIMKFCSKISFRRHLMILLLRAYSYEPDSPLKLSSPKNLGSGETEKHQSEKLNQKTKPDSEIGHADSKDGTVETASEENRSKDVFTIQIYQMIYHCVQIHNVKLLQRKPPKAKMEKVRKKEIDDCGLDLLMAKDACGKNSLDVNYEKDDDENTEVEKASWLKVFKVTWARFSSSKKGKDVNQDGVKLRWHQYYVEEPLKLFSLWGEIHPTGHMFSRENRGKQIQACYVICAGMTRIQAPEYWSPKTLDAIVMCGDRYYTMSKHERRNIDCGSEINDVECGERYLGRNFKIGETLFDVDVLDIVCGRLYEKHGRNLWKILGQMFLKEHFGILTCESSCLGIFKFCGSYYMIDVNSVGPPLFQYGDGVAYLVRATSYHEFMKVLVQTIGSSECSRFTINAIVIDKMIDLGTTDLRDEVGKVVLRKLECPYEDEAKGSKRWKSKDQDQKKSTINKVSCRKASCRN